MADTDLDAIETRIRLAAQSYQLAIWASDLQLADRYWHTLCQLRRHRTLIELGYDIHPEMPADDIGVVR